jgi:DNA-binding NtrC family response regulator
MLPVSAALSSSSAASAQSTQSTQSAYSRTRQRIVLVVTSDSSLRERLSHSLSSLRWQVLEAPGGAEAWMIARTVQLEAMLVDPWLPDLDVAEFLRDFQRDHPQVDLMMTDGVAAPNSPRSSYRQELLYALRSSQDGNTAAWNTAPALEENAGLPGLSGRSGWSDPSQLPPLAAAQDHVASVSIDPAVASAGNLAANRGGGVEGRTASSQVIHEVRHESGHESGHEAMRAEAAPSASPVVFPGALHREAPAIERIPELIGTGAVMLEVSRRIRLVAARVTPVLIEGPTGSGKELVAEALHRLSNRARKPFVAINCAAIPEALLEAELFGHTRGAFTGAVQGRIGRIEAADGGTLFLDEIGEMPLALQAKLLRFFESGELQRIGDNETVKVDVRIVAATHQPLAEDAQKGNFRADLYYRLAVFLIRTPALAEHMEDLSQLVAHFLERMGRKAPVKRIDGSAMARLASHSWPGNVRELEHVLERAAILAGDEPVITAAEIDFGHSLMN